MADKYCKEKHNRIDEKLAIDERRLNNHSDRIDALENFRHGTMVEIRNLANQIKELISAMKWIAIFAITTLGAFFIWYIQSL